MGGRERARGRESGGPRERTGSVAMKMKRREGEGDYYYPGWADDRDMFGEGESDDDC